MFRMTGTGDVGDVATDDTFAEALRSQFGDDLPPVEPDPSTDEEPGGEGGTSPLPSSPPETPEPVAPTPEPDAGGFTDEPIPEPNADLPPATPPTPDVPPTAEPDFDLNELFERYYGTRPTPQQMTSLLGFVDQVQRLSPAQQQALNAILSGQEPSPTPAPSGPVAPPALGQPGAPPAAPSTVPSFDDLTPEARAYLEPLYRQQQDIIARVQAQEAAQAAAQLEAQQAQIVNGIQTASTQFVQEFADALTPTDLVILESRAQQSGQFPFFMQQHGGNASAAYRALLETIAYSDPAIRAKMISASPPAPTHADTQRIQKASAVAAGGVAGNRVSPLTPNEPSAPTDPADAVNWAINEVSRVTGLPRIS